MISGAPELRRIHYATRALQHELLMHIETISIYLVRITYPTALPIGSYPLLWQSCRPVWSLLHETKVYNGTGERHTGTS